MAYPTELRAAMAAVQRARRVAVAMGADERPYELAERMVTECALWAQAVADDADTPAMASRLLGVVLGSACGVTGITMPYAQTDRWRQQARALAQQDASSSRLRDRLYSREV